MIAYPQARILKMKFVFSLIRTVKPASAAVKKNAMALRDAIAAEAEEMHMHAHAPSTADDADCTCSIGNDHDGDDFASLPEAVYRGAIQ